ncbi:uncharacterized protein DS421_2g47610 [Arachis hypogaea]|nr:uncharacterized protein DS421_2g47610 [Arachis hypogaea]
MTWSGCLVGVVVDNAHTFQVSNVHHHFLALLMNTPSLQHVGNVLEPFSRLHVCSLALATCMARLVGVGNVHGKACGRWQRGWCGLWALATCMARLVGVGNVVGGACGRWQRGWCGLWALATWLAPRLGA